MLLLKNHKIYRLFKVKFSKIMIKILNMKILNLLNLEIIYLIKIKSQEIRTKYKYWHKKIMNKHHKSYIKKLLKDSSYKNFKETKKN